MCLMMGNWLLEKILNLFYNYACSVTQGSGRVLLTPNDKQDLALPHTSDTQALCGLIYPSSDMHLLGKNEYNFLFCTLKFREGESI